jgi:hypothetical protein
MKKSELKKLIYETVQEAINSLLQDTTVGEGLDESRKPIADSMSLVNRLQSTNSNSLLSGLDKPQIKQEVIKGKTYTSGQGILEWFDKDKTNEITDSSKASGQQIDGLISRIMKP